MKNTFYRVDFWYKDGSGSEVRFEKTESAALAHVSAMQEITLYETDGREHVQIHPFNAETCDMQGWQNSDWETQAPKYYANSEQ